MRKGSGEFSAIDYEIGDVDDSGQGFIYTVYDADSECDRQLSVTANDVEHRLGGEPGPSCKPLDPTTRVDIE
jgi:hypothetical protein